MTSVRPLLLGLALALSACPAPTECDPLVDDCTDGGLRPDFCDSRQQADEDAVHCQLALGVPLDGGAYLGTVADGGVDTDWYLAVMPAALTGRSLLHVNGGYSAPQTAVTFQLNVLVPSADGGLISLATGADNLQGGRAPTPVDLVVPFSQSGARVYLLVGDKVTGATFHVDNRNTYSLLAEVIENPDQNEPNDVVATPVPLPAGNGGLQGSVTGALATNDDVDRYAFSLSPLVGRQIVYLHLTGPSPQLSPPPAFGRLQYTLLDPMGTPLAEGVMDNEFQVIDLATARLATGAGTYTVVVKGYQPANSTAVVKGDLRLQYTLQIRILPDLDANEPDDDLGHALGVSFAGLGSKSLTGKLSYVQDEEWFKVTLPARAGPSTLRYRVAVAAGGGRFAPLSTQPSRQLRLLQPVVTGGTSQDDQVACLTSRTACPKGFTDPNSPDRILVESLCKAFTPPECLYAERDETIRFDNLKNEVGAIPVEANKLTTVYVMFRDQGLARAKYADDRDWTLNLDWVDDPDRAARLAGPTVVALGGATTASSGQLTFGYGALLNGFDLATGAGIRGPNDYDAFETDKDLWQFNLGAATTQSWAVSWDLQHGDGGVPPGDLALEITTCTGAGPGTDGGLCPGARTFIFGYSAQSLSPWYQPNNASTAVPLFSRVNGPGSLTVTALPIGCECFSANHAAAGRIFVNVAGVNRVSNEPISYTLRQSIAPYPTPATCPVVDAGCGFDKGP